MKSPSRKTMQRSRPRAKVGMISLGCPKNLVDTEVLLGKVAEDYLICGDPEDADVVIVNTCGFIDAAREESYAAIREVAEWKKQGKVRGLIVAGCMAQRYGAEIRSKVPTVDSIIAMAEYSRIGEVLSSVLDAKGAARAAQAPWRVLVAKDGKVPVVREETARLRVTPRHYAYLRISEGCSNACTFCSIPTFRGLFRSKPADTILAEARELVASGARELDLISQDTTDWGRDLGGAESKRGLSWLLSELSRIEGVRWIRMLYAYPGHVSDELLATFARLVRQGEKGTVVPYLDMPIQHISSRMLKRMGRRHTREETCELLSKLRERVPGIALRTTFITGFPGETEEDHRELLEFVREFRFDRMGVFTYSHEKNTPAGERFEDDVPQDVKKRRQDELMEAQQEIAFAEARKRKGSEVEVVVEGESEEQGTFVARSVWDAPEIDPVVHLEAPEGTEVGSFLIARITGTSGYDLVAKAASLPRTKRPKAAPRPKRGKAPRRLPLLRSD